MGESDGHNDAILRQAQNCLHRPLAHFVAAALQEEFGAQWWEQGVLSAFDERKTQHLPAAGDFETLAGSLDLRLCLQLLTGRHWRSVFSRKLRPDHRNWANEVLTRSHDFAHRGSGQAFSADDLERALDTMVRLSREIDEEACEELSAMLREVRYGSRSGSLAPPSAAPEAAGSAPAAAPGAGHAALEASAPAAAASGLPRWQDVIRPHPDVAAGRYRQAEFAADLWQVARGTAAQEYLDPHEFFARTYVTAGLRGLLRQALQRVSGQGGEPVVQLKTAFGGGKTHSMLALYHLLRSAGSASPPPLVQELMAEAGVVRLPRVRVAVLVGTALDPSSTRRPPSMPGITIATMWGEMTAQLATDAGDKQLYKLIRSSDSHGVEPGSEVLRRILDQCGPCLVLIDEMVAYARKLYGKRDRALPAGTFDNFLTFVQSLTEAARASASSLVVASIPESDLELGGEGGREALRQIEHTFGRMEAVWKPVAAEEGFAVVRRRLFLPCTGAAEAERDRVCQAFARMYQQEGSGFPPEAREADYETRLQECYPIHPEVFDRLYNDWSTLERFQRTRGVLRLMAAVVHELYSRDCGPMIMAGSLPLDVAAVRDELTRCLDNDNQWNAVVDSEVDGRRSWPVQTDQANEYLRRHQASQRMARAIMLGSAPRARGSRLRGIEVERLLLGVVVPGEKTAVFTDALAGLREGLQYLYSGSGGTRLWYDTRPTLIKKVRELAARDDIVAQADADILDRLRRLLRSRGDFAGVHVVGSGPGAAAEVADTQEARLVVLGPQLVHDPGVRAGEDSLALAQAREILEHAGTGLRQYRNMLVFAALDAGAAAELRRGVCICRAWQTLADDQELCATLSQNEIKEIRDKLARAQQDVTARLNAGYRHLLLPPAGVEGGAAGAWRLEVLAETADEGIAVRASAYLKNTDWLLTKLDPAGLLEVLERWLWQGQACIGVGRVWQMLCSYGYLPRLMDFAVLQQAIADGLAAGECFALARGCSGEGEAQHFEGLRCGEAVDPATITAAALLVRADAARRQLAAAGASVAAGGTLYRPAGGDPIPSAPEPAPGGAVRSGGMLRHFYATVELDPVAMAKNYDVIRQEVIGVIRGVPGCRLSVRLVVDAEFDTPLPDDRERTLRENCDALKLQADFIPRT